jgi:hypothetical protein
MKEKWQVILPVLLMVAFALTRWPGLLPENFSAAYALAFCAGAFFPRALGWWLPLGTLLITDLLLNWYYRAPLLGLEMVGNYLAYGALIWLGRKITGRASFLRLLGGGIWGAILFYLITNTLSWLHDPAYPKTLAGWIQALTVGTPGWPHTWEFFRNTLLSGGLFTGLFVGAMKLGEAAEKEAAEEEEKEPPPQEQPAETEPEEAKP